jgi:hypothetical protein
MTKSELPLGMQAVHAVRWFIAGVASTLLILFLVELANNGPVAMGDYIAPICLVMLVVLLAGAWYMKASPGWRRRSNQPKPNL